MNKLKPIVFLIIVILTFFLLSKINFKQDLIWNIKNLFHPKIVFHLKKIYILYTHDFKNKITIEKDRENLITSSKGREFNFITFKNTFFKKNGPKVFLELSKNNLISITGTGLISFTELKNFNLKKDLKIIRSNLRELVSLEQIVNNPGFILNMKIFNDEIYVSYINELRKNCFNTTFVMGKLNFKKINFQKIYSPKDCIDTKNTYGEFYILEAGGAIELIDENKIFISTGTFRYRDLTQNEESIFGKVLLIDLSNNLQKVISMGHRNIQGMYYDNKKEILFFIDHGPQGGDEINLDLNPLDNIIENYGWPIASYGEHYGGKIEKNKKKYKKAPLFKSHKLYSFTEPLKYFVPSIAPSDLLFVPEKFDPKFKNNIYISSLGFTNEGSTRSIHSFFYNDKESKLLNHEIIKLDDRIRDIEYNKELNFIILSLEKSGSIGILQKL